MSVLPPLSPKVQIGTMLEIISPILGKLDFGGLKKVRLVCKLWADEAGELLLQRSIFRFSCGKPGTWFGVHRSGAIAALENILCFPFLRERRVSSSLPSPKCTLHFKYPPWPRVPWTVDNFIRQRVTEVQVPIKITASDLNSLLNFLPAVHTLTFTNSPEYCRPEVPGQRNRLVYFSYHGTHKWLEGLPHDKGLQANLEKLIQIRLDASAVQPLALEKISEFLNTLAPQPPVHLSPCRGLRSINNLRFSDYFHRSLGSDKIGRLLETQLCANHWRISKLTLTFSCQARGALPPGLLRKFLCTPTFSTSLRELNVKSFTLADRCRQWLSQPCPWTQENAWEIPKSLWALKNLTFQMDFLDHYSTEFEEDVAYYFAATVIQTFVQLKNLSTLRLKLQEYVREGQVEKISTVLAGILDNYNNGKIYSEAETETAGARERAEPPKSLTHLKLGEFALSIILNPILSRSESLAWDSVQKLTCVLVLTMEDVENIFRVLFTKFGHLRHLNLTLKDKSPLFKNTRTHDYQHRPEIWEDLLLGRRILNQPSSSAIEEKEDETRVEKLEDLSKPSIRHLKGLTGLRIEHDYLFSKASTVFTDLFIQHGLSHMPSLMGVEISPRQGVLKKLQGNLRYPNLKYPKVSEIEALTSFARKFSPEAIRHLTTCLSPHAYLDI